MALARKAYAYNGAVRRALNLYVHDGVAQRTVYNAYYHNGTSVITAFQRVWASFGGVSSGFNAALDWGAQGGNGNTTRSVAVLRVARNGYMTWRAGYFADSVGYPIITATGAVNAMGSWSTPGNIDDAGDQFWVKATVSAGGPIDGGASVGVWYSLQYDREWEIYSPYLVNPTPMEYSEVIKGVTLTLQISTTNSDAGIIATGSRSIQASVYWDDQ